MTTGPPNSSDAPSLQIVLRFILDGNDANTALRSFSGPEG